MTEESTVLRQHGRARPTRRAVLASGACAAAAALVSPARAAAAPLPGRPGPVTAAALALTDLDEAALAKRAVARHKTCDLDCPTGRIVACDPLVGLGDWTPFARAVAPGRHPAFAYVDLGNPWGRRVGLAELRFSDAPVAEWRMALSDESILPDMVGNTISGYLVDAGMGCFCDAATQLSFRVTERIRQFFGTPSYGEGELLEAALKVETDAEHRLAADPGRNIALYASGYGDGYYASYWGLAADETPSRLVTNFFVFDSDTESSTPPAAAPSPHPSAATKEQQ